MAKTRSEIEDEAIAKCGAIMTGANVKGHLLAFHSENDEGVKIAKVNISGMGPRNVMTLALMAFEQGAALEMKNSPDAPAEYHEAMSQLLEDISEASRVCNAKLMAIPGTKEV